MSGTGLGTSPKKVKRAVSKRKQYMDYVMDTQSEGGKAMPMQKWLAGQKKDD